MENSKEVPEREFFVWVDPQHWMIQHQLALVGTFTGGPVIQGPVDGPDGLPFIKNPNPKALEQSMSPFHLNIVRDYMVEWNLELVRFNSPEFKQHPSRLHALFLLNTKQDAGRYAEIHPEHVKGRILKRGLTVGSFLCSIHDAAWVDFMRLGHSVDNDTVWEVGRAYWRGQRADATQFTSMGKPWFAQTSLEVLFYGRLDFPNKSLTPDV